MRCTASTSKNVTASSGISASVPVGDVDPFWVPENLQGVPAGSISYLLRTSPPHLSPAIHQYDGDGCVLALTVLPDGTAFIRNRYVRTTAYLRELRASKRLYLSRGGTAPESRKFRKLKAASADAIFSWGERLFASGHVKLPMLMDSSALVSRGYSALGAALTDGEELARDRGAAIVTPPVINGDIITICSRSENNRLLFIVQLDQQFNVVQRLPPQPCSTQFKILDLAVTGNWCVVLIAEYIKNKPLDVMRLFLDGDAPLPDIDAQSGAKLMIIPRNQKFLDRPKQTIVQLPNLYHSFVQVTEDESQCLNMSALQVETSESTFSAAQFSDVISGDLQSQAVTKLTSFKVNPSTKEINNHKSQASDTMGNVSIRSLSPCRKFATVYDLQGERYGWARVTDGEITDITWKSGSISGLAASQDGLALSALVHGTSETPEIQFWSAGLSNPDKTLGSVSLDSSNFGTVPRCFDADWSSILPKFPPNGKVVKSAYELFDEKNWNDIESSFSGLGFNQ